MLDSASTSQSSAPVHNKPLSESENTQLAGLLSRLTFPTSSNVFDSICNCLPTVAVELAVLKKGEAGTRILLIWRDDKYFKGWHMPGTVMLQGDTEESAFERLRKKEVCKKISQPQFIDRFHFLKGNGRDQCARGQEIGLFFVCQLEEDREERAEEKLFPLDNLPDDVLGHHMVMIEKLRLFLSTGS